MREHQPVLFDKFNGLWDRGNIEETPLDHFSDCNNIKFIGSSAFGSRDGIGPHQTVNVPLSNILRIYNYPTQIANTLLVLTTGGQIYHVVDSGTIYGPILTIGAMTDFGFIPYAGRAYITPFTTEVQGELNIERGLHNEYLYVYKGDGTPARKAGGTTPTGVITVANGISGNTDAGVHIFGVVYETDTGYLTSPGALVAFTTTAGFSVSFSTIPNSPDAFVIKKHLVASKAITNYDGNVNGYTLYFIPNAIINDNVGTTLSNISFFDADLLEDASHLSDNFDLISAGVGLALYHNRLILYTEYANISLVRVSSVGEPEAISKIDGLLIFPPDGNPITNAAELRDVLYVTKRSKSVGFIDNGDVPSSWPMTVADAAMGCGVHGIATVLDSGSSNVNFLMVSTYKGIALFNGMYILPELTWKIQNKWISQDFKNSNRIIQSVNDALSQILYVVLTDRTVLVGNYANGLDPKSIRWTPWTFDLFVNTLALWNVNELILGCAQI